MAVGVPAIITLLAVQHRKVGAIKEQVQNSHASNLREDMDETRRIATDAATDAKLGAESSHRTERLVEDLVRSTRAMEHSADRRDAIATKAKATKIVTKFLFAGLWCQSC